MIYYKFTQNDYNDLIIVQISNKDIYDYLTKKKKK